MAAVDVSEVRCRVLATFEEVVRLLPIDFGAIAVAAANYLGMALLEDRSRVPKSCSLVTWTFENLVCLLVAPEMDQRQTGSGAGLCIHLPSCFQASDLQLVVLKEVTVDTFLVARSAKERYCHTAAVDRVATYCYTQTGVASQTVVRPAAVHCTVLGETVAVRMDSH